MNHICNFVCVGACVCVLPVSVSDLKFLDSHLCCKICFYRFAGANCLQFVSSGEKFLCAKFKETRSNTSGQMFGLSDAAVTVATRHFDRTCLTPGVILQSETERSGNRHREAVFQECSLKAPKHFLPHLIHFFSTFHGLIHFYGSSFCL